MWMTFQEKVLLCIFHILSGTLKFLIFYVPAVYYNIIYIYIVQTSVETLEYLQHYTSLSKVHF